MALRIDNLAAHRRARAPGFTLIEAALTTVIVGIGFTAMMQLVATGTATNLQGAEQTTATNLAKNIHEMTLKMPFSQLMALNGQNYSPAVDSQGNAMNEFGHWTQSITVQPVDPDRVTLVISDATPSAERITIQVSHNGNVIGQMSWYSFQ